MVLFMANYYYVGVSLSPLSFDAPPEITFEELERLLKDNLSTKDYQKIQLIRHYYDILNLRSYWLGEPLDPRGELNSLELSEALATQVGLPSYVYDFMLKYESKKERIHHFSFLLAKFFQKAGSEKNLFLKNYFSFERELRLVWTGYRAKKLGRDLSIQLQYEDPEENLIAQLLAQKDARNFELPEKFLNLREIFENFADHPFDLEKALDQYRIEYIEKTVEENDKFSIDRILAYTIQLVILEKWFELDKQKGKEIIDRIVRGT
ncbi:unnamed protein product [Candidatus Protochlamydia amoebophila UWE25]|uniref:DUF2764 domain-containing protein n=2 Tax=Candidatus Protochlamydia amoebophila TaxID=362787 RepID=Q6MAJ4_PARUW|nr:unnamed protein product [Candidatus Protochlamydia amoebophila UWE25]